jgi:hypothetical protein
MVWSDLLGVIQRDGPAAADARIAAMIADVRDTARRRRPAAGS